MNDSICITILVDNIASKPGILAEHGLSLWIECHGKRILFDTGQSDILTQNAKILGIDLAKTDAIILSHGHYDHTGGLYFVSDIAPNAPIYMHPGTIEPKYSLKKMKVRDIGMPEASKKILKNHQIIQTENIIKICDGITLTGQIPRTNDFEDTGGAFFCDQNCRNPDNLLDDQALVIESSRGLIIVLGCAHSGTANTLEYVLKLTNHQKIYTVVGGMHLANADMDRINSTIDILKEFDVQKIIPLHCSGSLAIIKMIESFHDKCLLLGAGDNIIFNT